MSLSKKFTIEKCVLYIGSIIFKTLFKEIHFLRQRMGGLHFEVSPGKKGDPINK
jgi:hypothetical protein